MTGSNGGLSDRELDWITKLDDVIRQGDAEQGRLLMGQAWKQGSYVIRHKALEIFKVLGRKEDIDFLAGLALDQSLEEEYRLRALSVLGHLGFSEAVPRIEPLLEDPNPFLPKAVITVLGQIGGSQAVLCLLQYGSSPQGRLVKREIFGEAIAYAVSSWPGGTETIDQCQASQKAVRRFLRGLDLTVPPLPRYSAFPSNDYMAGKVKSRGIAYRKFKYLVEE